MTNKFLVHKKYDVSVEVFDLSDPADLHELARFLTVFERVLTDGPEYLHPEWVLADEELQVQCEECVEEWAAAERSGMSGWIEPNC